MAAVLGLEHVSIKETHSPESLPMTPDAQVEFFELVLADAHSHYVLTASDVHLSADLVVLQEEASLRRGNSAIRSSHWCGFMIGEGRSIFG